MPSTPESNRQNLAGTELTAGRLTLLGSTSGTTTVSAPDVAGDTQLTWPSTSGTLAVEGGAGVLPPAVVDLDTADLLTLFSSPVELLPAPGVGKVNMLISVMVQAVFNSRQFYGTDGGLYFGGPSSEFANFPAGITGASDVDLNPLLATGGAVAVFHASTALVYGAFIPTVYLENQPTVVAVGSDYEDFGGITASALNAAGADYAPGDTGTIGFGAPKGAVYVVDTVLVGAVVTYHIGSPGFALQVGSGQSTTPAAITPTIISVNQGTKKFGVRGNFAAFFALPFTSVVVAGSTGNDGTYTIVSAAYAAGVTLVTVVEALPSSVADGTITAGQAGAGDAAFTVDVSTIVPGDGSARVWVTYFIADLA